MASGGGSVVFAPYISVTGPSVPIMANSRSSFLKAFELDKRAKNWFILHEYPKNEILIVNGKYNAMCNYYRNFRKWKGILPVNGFRLSSKLKYGSSYWFGIKKELLEEYQGCSKIQNEMEHINFISKNGLKQWIEMMDMYLRMDPALEEHDYRKSYAVVNIKLCPPYIWRGKITSFDDQTKPLLMI